MLTSMRRVDIVAPRSRALILLRALHRAGVVHLVPFDPPPGTSAAVFGPYPATPGTTPFDEQLAAVAELAAGLAVPRAPTALVAELWELDDAALGARVADLAPVRRRVAVLTGERVRTAGEIGRLEGYRRLTEGLHAVIGRLPTLRGYGSTAVVIEARYRALLGVLRDELEELTAGRCEVIAGELSPDRLAALFVYPSRLAEEVRTLLGGRDLEEVTLPEELVGLPFDELQPRLARQEGRLRDRDAAAAAELVRIGLAHGPLIAALEVVLRDRVAEANALRVAGASEHLVVVCGWVPARRLEALCRALTREVGPEVLVIERPVDAATLAAAPVALENRPLTRFFEPLASFVSLPRYGSLDPTPFLAVTFPIFVGLMVGDIGYGLVLLGLVLWARRRWRDAPLMRTVGPIAILAAVSTVVFGVVFGELFGDAGATLFGLRPLWFDRRDAVVPLLALAVAIGVAQVGLGLVLGMANAALLGKRHHLWGRTAMLASLVAALLLLGAAGGYLPPVAGHIAAAGLAVALVVLLVSVGLAGPIELVGIFGNVLSYARLMAIGLASVMLAVVANQLGGLVANVVVGALVAVLLHVLNLTLGFFDASVQGLRLHYVEFFGRWVEPGGVPFQPFASVLQRSEGRLQPIQSGGD